MTYKNASSSTELSAKAKGNIVEDNALKYLQTKKLKLVARNFAVRQGEIDLIMRDGKTLVFVEVRCRKNPIYGHAEETVTRSKQERIIKTAMIYLQQNRLTDKASCRFDVITTQSVNHAEKLIYRWIPNAFQL